MSRKNLSNRLVWVAAATIVAAAMLVPAALADKPASNSKPIAAEKTWVKVGGGKGYGTYLKLDTGFAGALTTLGIAPALLKPASDPSDNPNMGFRFPITQGKLTLSYDSAKAINGVHGTVGHVGGLSLKKGDVTVRVRNLVIVAHVSTTDTSKLTAQVNGKRIDFATLKFAAFPVIAGKTVTATVSEVRLTAAAASALNGAFSLSGGSAIPADTLVGSATMKARLVGKGKA